LSETHESVQALRRGRKHTVKVSVAAALTCCRYGFDARRAVQPFGKLVYQWVIEIAVSRCAQE
jgi:hypothetical protein